VDTIAFDIDPDDPELVGAVARVATALTRERQDLADPLTAIEADRRIGTSLPDASIEYEPAALLGTPVWRVRRDGAD
jgi:hypothetical protein